eukprot:200234_1
MAFTNDVFYCLTNEILDLAKNINSSIHAFNANDGTTLWKTYIDQSSTYNKTAFDGIVSLPPNYVAVLDNNNADLFILNSSNGNIISNVSVYPNCRKVSESICIESGLISSSLYDSIFIHYVIPRDLPNAYLFQFNTVTKQTSSINIIEAIAENPQIPTICNEDVIVSTNLFANVSAFNISDNKWTSLWNYSMTNNYGTVYINPILCIPRIDGSFNVLVNSLLEAPDFEIWELIDGSTGTLLQEIIWLEDTTGIPVINTDKMILIRTTIEQNNIIAYDISDINGNWTQLWNISAVEYMDVMVINNNVFLSNEKQIDVYSIDNGTKIDSWLFPMGEGESRLSASLDANNEPMIIVIVIRSIDLPDMKATLYALQ